MRKMIVVMALLLASFYAGAVEPKPVAANTAAVSVATAPAPKAAVAPAIASKETCQAEKRASTDIAKLDHTLPGMGLQNHPTCAPGCFWGCVYGDGQPLLCQCWCNN